MEELGVIAGSVDADTVAPEVFFLDPSDKAERYGGFDGWTRCVEGYLDARGYGASVAVGPDREATLAAARSRRFGTVVVVEDAAALATSASAGRAGPTRAITAVGLAAPRVGRGSPANTQAPRPAPSRGQLGLPGLVLGRPKRSRKPKTVAAARPKSAGAA